jgi:predicted nucleic acid-binding Zn ribbon protein
VFSSSSDPQVCRIARRGARRGLHRPRSSSASRALRSSSSSCFWCSRRSTRACARPSAACLARVVEFLWKRISKGQLFSPSGSKETRFSPKNAFLIVGPVHRMAGMDHYLSRTRTLPSPTDFELPPTTLAHPEPSEPSIGQPATIRSCAVCGKRFSAKRPEARACSGRCRMQTSRNRRLTELVERLARAEAALEGAHVALAAVRELASIGTSRVMP